MQKFSEFICKHKKAVLVISAILFVLSIIGSSLTKINYDILVYLPEDIETIKGQNILTEEFGMGAFSIATIENMPAKDILALESEIQKIDGVQEVASLYDIVGTSIPLEALPEEIITKVHDDNSDLLMITFSDSTSADSTMRAVEEIRTLTDEKVKQGGMSSMVLDTRDLSSKEIAIYAIIAVALCLLILELALDSYIVPIILLANIGIAIVFNLGSNIFLGQISYITKALVAVLQLGVTTDFSIFLYHSYDKQKKICKTKEEAMVQAIKETFTSVTGSSLTTIVGFLVLMTMQLTLGRDLGIVMAKGVLLGVICVLTLFPSLLLTFDKIITKTKHKTFIPNFKHLHNFIIEHHIAIFAIFLLLLVPAYLANSKVDVYYKMDRSLPDTLESITANTILKDKFNIVSPEMILLDSEVTPSTVEQLKSELENLDGIDLILDLSSLKRLGIDSKTVNSNIIDMFETEDYQMLILNSTYEIASDELNAQIDKVNSIVKKYDASGMAVGEGPLMKDLITVTDTDFKNVNYSSIICIFLVLFIVLKSLSLPFLLILSIEFAIFLNMGFSYFGGVTLPFVAPIVLGTIQLGATIDYAILVTTTYLKNRERGLDKTSAMRETLSNTTNSIFVSGMCFFAATFGVGMYSALEMVGSLCTLISRGAIISMIVVITVLPSILLIFDKLILKTTLKSRKEKNMKKNKTIKHSAVITMAVTLAISSLPLSVFALSKEETVYGKMDEYGSIKEIIVNELLDNDEKSKTIKDYSELENILNINDDSTFEKSKNDLIWNSNGKNMFYRGTTKKELPIKMSIDYSLNGKSYKLEDILGKKGNITIKLKYTNLDSHRIGGSTLYTPFTITVGTMLDASLNTNVKVNNGKVVSNGSNNIIIGLAMPGLYDSLKFEDLKGLDTITISFYTEEFSLPSIYSVAVPKLVTADDLSRLDEIEKLYSSVDKLKTNMDKIEEGSHALKEGSHNLKSAFHSSISKPNGNKVLDEKTLESIKKSSENAVTSKFTPEYKAALGETAWQQVQSSLTENDEAITKIVTDATTEYLKSTGLYEDYVRCLRAQNVQSAGGMPDSSDLASCQIISNDKTLPYIINSAKSVAKQTAYYTSEKVSKSIAPIIAEQSAISTAGSISTQVASQVAISVKNASISSLNTLYEGISSLDTGIQELDAGITEFNKEGITKIKNAVDNEVRPAIDRTRSLVKLGENYKSFGGKLDDTNGETKFVMIVDGKSAPKQEEKLQVKDEKTTLWERIKNLFK